MAGRKFGVVMAVQVPASYHSLPQREQDVPGKVMGALMEKYAGKVDMLRRYWTSAFTADATDVFVIEADDLMEVHNLNQELTRDLAKEADPDQFGVTVAIYVGVNPDAG